MSENVKKIIERCKTCGRPLTKGRSNPQNKSYWKLCVEPLAEYLEGYTTEDIHCLLKHKFLSEIRYVKNRNGMTEEVKVTKSTTSLTTVEFNLFMESIRQWASELGLYLNEPNEQPLTD